MLEVTIYEKLQKKINCHGFSAEATSMLHKMKENLRKHTSISKSSPRQNVAKNFQMYLQALLNIGPLLVCF